jgi:transcriptional regulator with XRE-family HTH domain
MAISASRLVAEARRRAGLSQAALAARAGTAQSAVARIESGKSAPSVETLERLVRAAGFTLVSSLAPVAAEDAVIAAYAADVDRSLIRANLRRTVDERLSALESATDDLATLAAAVQSARRRRR